MKIFRLLTLILFARLTDRLKKGILIILDIRSVSQYLHSYNLDNDSEAGFRFENYSNSNLLFSTWVDRMFWNQKKTLRISFVYAISIYFVGFLIAYSINFHQNYIRTSSVYLGIAGIFLTLFCLRIGSKKVNIAYEQLRPCFLITDSQYNHIVKKWHDRLTNNTGHFIFSCLLIIFSIATVYFQVFNQKFLIELQIESFGPASLKNHGWYTSENNIIKALILVYYAIIICLLFGTSLRIIVLNLFLLFDFKNIPVIPLPSLVKGRLSKMANFYTFISLNWFLGVALFGILFFSTIDFVSIFIIVLLSTLGVITFTIPQFIYGEFIQKSDLLLNQWKLASFYKKFNLELIEKEYNTIITINNGVKILDQNLLNSYEENSNPAKKWVYNMKDIVLFIFGQSIAILSPLIGTSIKGLFQ